MRRAAVLMFLAFALAACTSATAGKCSAGACGGHERGAPTAFYSAR